MTDSRTIPDYQTCMLPFLKVISDGNERTLNEVEDLVAGELGVTDLERSVLLPSGQQFVFRNRIGWARTYLKKAGLIDAVRRGVFQITKRGRDALAQKPERIGIKFLEQYAEFRDFQNLSRSTSVETTPSPSGIQAAALSTTPRETIEVAFQELRDQLSEDLLQRVLSCSPVFFEQLVVELLVKMGYGGSRRDAGQRVGQSGDGGIDGIIKEDRLGLDTIFIQAKRWQGVVGRPEVQKFVGALQGQRAKKGVFITTSSFTKEAVDYCSLIDTKVVLIDGTQLTALMMDFNVGVSDSATYVIKRLDGDYFEDS